MKPIDDSVQTLINLGLTILQAKVYITLAKSGASTARTTAKVAQVARQDVYRILAELQEKGLIEKIIAKPIMYKATPVKESVSILLKNKKQEYIEAEKQAQVIFNNFNENNNQNISSEKVQFAIVSGKEIIIQRLKEAILKTKMSVCVVTSEKRFSDAILEFEKIYREVSGKGVIIKIATNRHIPQEEVLKIVETLSKVHSFAVKYFDDPPPAIVTIFDNKEAFVTLSATAQLAGASAIWSNNPSFIALAQSYFENQWNKAS